MAFSKPLDKLKIKAADTLVLCEKEFTVLSIGLFSLNRPFGG